MEESKDKWQEFKDYCLEDVKATQAMRKAIDKHIKEHPEDKENRVAIFTVCCQVLSDHINSKEV